jgi:hypothetical protein
LSILPDVMISMGITNDDFALSDQCHQFRESIYTQTTNEREISNQIKLLTTIAADPKILRDLDECRLGVHDEVPG